MPQLGESIAEATVREILVSPDDTVSADQDIFQVETDKAIMEVGTPCGGMIVEVIAEVDKSYAVGGTLAYLEASEEDAVKAGLIKTTPPPSDSDSDQEEKPHFAVDESEVIEGEEPATVDEPTVKPTR